MDKIAVIEARLYAGRLPGKVLMPLAGTTMIERIIDKVKCSNLLDDIVLATTSNSEDDLIEYIGKQCGVRVHRGSSNNVMERVLGASNHNKNSILVQVTGDNPFIEPQIIDDVISKFKGYDLDYVCNDMPRNVPLGCEVRAYKRSIIEKIDQDKIDQSHLSNITSIFYEYKKRYKICNINTRKIHQGKNLRLTVDEPQDYILADIIYKEMCKEDKSFNLEKVINFLNKNKILMKINLNVRQKDLSEG